MCVCVRGEGEEDRVPCERERREMVDGRAAALTTMAQLLSNAPLVSKIAMTHQEKVRHYYVQKRIKAWSNIVMAHFLLGAPLLF